MKSFVRTALLSAALVGVIGVAVAAGTLLYIASFYGMSADGRADCAVIFGAAVWPGGMPSHALSDRVLEGVDLYDDEQVSCLILSGAPSAYDKHEVDVMLDVAYERDVALEDIELDYHGLNTRHTINNLNPERSYIFVSNDFHLARINLLARQTNLDDYQLHASTYRLGGRYTGEWFFVLREFGAFWYYAFVNTQS